MRRKQQIQALQQELALLRQTVDSGKELAALAADAAGQLRRPGLRTVAVQVMRSPRVRRAFAAPRSSSAARSPPSRSALPRCTAGCIRPSSRSQKGAQARQRPP